MSAGLIERGKEKREGNRGEAGELTERRSGSRRGGHSDLAASRIFPSARNGVACASLLVREDPPRGHAHLRRPCGPAHLRRPLGPASSAPPRGGASAGRQPRAAAALSTSSVSLRPRATPGPARLQWQGNSISNLSSLCSAGMLLCFMPLLVATVSSCLLLGCFRLLLAAAAVRCCCLLLSARLLLAARCCWLLLLQPRAAQSTTAQCVAL